MALCGLLMAGTAQAEWRYQQGPDAGRHAAYVCADGTGGLAGQRLCFGLACGGDAPLSFGMSAHGAPDLLARFRLDVLGFAGARAMAPLLFEANGLGTFEAPVTQAHLPALEHLKAGATLELRYWEAVDQPPTVWRLSLAGSRDALTAVQAACPLPDFAAQARAARTVADPQAQVLAQMTEACTALDGVVTVGEDYATPLDLDGVAPVDLVLRHGALRCSSARDLVCGPAGCLTSIWQAGRGGYTRVFLNAVQDVAADPTKDRAGAVRLTLKGSLCGRIGAGPCQQVWTLRDGVLAPEK